MVLTQHTSGLDNASTFEWARSSSAQEFSDLAQLEKWREFGSVDECAEFTKLRCKCSKKLDR